jgi:hypothetical protein
VFLKPLTFDSRNLNKWNLYSNPEVLKLWARVVWVTENVFASSILSRTVADWWDFSWEFLFYRSLNCCTISCTFCGSCAAKFATKIIACIVWSDLCWLLTSCWYNFFWKDLQFGVNRCEFPASPFPICYENKLIAHLYM